MNKEEKKEICPNCAKEGIKEELLLIPPGAQNKRPILYCGHCEGEFPCNNGKRMKPKNIVCY